ncbi:MAG: hypothetical protein IJP34_04820 [Clostridia bacterium]|nr:hypothetical protein [Clostridia bacterium]
MKMYDGVLARVREMEQKRGIKYARTNGKLYKTLKVLYSIIGIWTFFMNLFFVLGFLLMYSNTDSMSKALNPVITVSVCTLGLIAGYVLNCVKLHIPSVILNILSSSFLIAVFAGLLQDTFGLWGYKVSFYWRHLAPILLIVIFSVFLTVIALREKYKTQKLYKKVTENLFDTYNIGNEENISEEQWEEFLQNYNPLEKINKKQEADEG